MILKLVPGTVQSVERAAAILQLLGIEDESLGLVQIAGALGLAKGTAHGLLRTLHGVGFVEQDASGRYRLGPDLFHLGSTQLDLNELKALGKVLLAFDPGAARSLGALDSLTYRTITNRAQLQHELADTRDRGWAASVEEEQPGVASIAAPVRDRGGYVVASIGISGDVERLCDHRARPLERLAELVVRAGRSVSREFGHGREL